MLDLLHVITAGSTFFLAFLVFTLMRDANPSANRWLAIFLLILGLFLIDDSLLVYGIYEKYTGLIGLLGTIPFALAPTLYCAVCQFVSINRRFNKSLLWHFSPFFLLSLLSLPFLLMAPVELKIKEISQHNTPTFLDKIILGALIVQIMVYLVLSFWKLQAHRRNIEKITASPQDIKLDWLLFFLTGVSVMAITWTIELYFTPFITSAGWYTFLYLAGIYALGYFALKQKEVFPYTKNEAQQVFEILSDESTPQDQKRQLGYSEDKIEELKTRLRHLMENEKNFLDTNLNLPGLSQKMGLSLHELSELINVGFDENFSQFVNRYRIEESKKLLLSEQHSHLNIVGIALESGFNSKTAFNTTFKKLVGVSPSTFRDQHFIFNNLNKD